MQMLPNGIERPLRASRSVSRLNDFVDKDDDRSVRREDIVVCTSSSMMPLASLHLPQQVACLPRIYTKERGESYGLNFPAAASFLCGVLKLPLLLLCLQLKRDEKRWGSFASCCDPLGYSHVLYPMYSR